MTGAWQCISCLQVESRVSSIDVHLDRSIHFFASFGFTTKKLPRKLMTGSMNGGDVLCSGPHKTSCYAATYCQPRTLQLYIMRILIRCTRWEFWSERVISTLLNDFVNVASECVSMLVTLQMVFNTNLVPRHRHVYGFNFNWSQNSGESRIKLTADWLQCLLRTKQRGQQNKPV